MFYYILKDPDKPNKSKPGTTKKPEVRIRAYRTAGPQCYFYRLYKDIDKRHENRILDILRDVYHVDREYVHCNPEMVANIVESYFEDNDINHLTTK